MNTLGSINLGFNQFKPTTNTLKQSTMASLPTQDWSVFNSDAIRQQTDPFYNSMVNLYQNQHGNDFVDNFLKPFNYGISTLGTLGGLYMGFQKYKLMKDQEGMAKEQWERTKQELDRIQNVRNRITNQYLGK